MKKDTGFTLIEMMMVVAILGVLASIAMPAFTDMMRTFRVRAASDMLIATITQSRIEAMRRGVPVVIVRNGTADCSATLGAATEWNCGWTAFADNDNNGVQGVAEVTLKTINEPRGAGVTHAGPTDNRLTVTRFGQPGNVGERFVIYPADDGIGHASTTTVCINAGGRIRKLTGTPACTVN